MMKASAALAASLIIWGQTGVRPRFEFNEVHMGLPVRVALYAPDRDAAESAARAAFARIAVLDAMMSDYRPDSEISRLPESRGWVAVSPDLFSVLSKSLEVSRASDGAFDPTIGPLTTLWREARRTRALASATALESARGRVSWKFIEMDAGKRSVRITHPGVLLDLGGIAKGYILQEALAVLVSRGTPAALLEAGGDIVAGDAPPGLTGWHIDVPYGDAAFQARARRLVRAALATSGPTFQFAEIDGVRYSHVIDPRTGRALTGHRVVSVIARDGAIADALATACGVLDAAGAAKLAAAFPDAVVSRQGNAPSEVQPSTPAR